MFKTQRFGVWLFLALMALAVGVAVQAQATPVHSVSFNGISFSYSGALGDSVNIWNFAGDPPTLQQPGGAQPPQTAFYIYDSTVPTENNFGTAAARASVTVYDLGQFGGYDFSQNEVSALRDLLTQRPDLTTFERAATASDTGSIALPFLPVYPAGQVLRAHTSYVQTTTLSGISYITVFRQDVSPFTADEFFYTVQAITNDNHYYVSAIQRINIASFPATLDSVNYDEFTATIDQYFADSIAQINNAAAGDITPATTLLDDVVNSLTIGEVIQPVEPAQPVEPTNVAIGGETGSNALTGTWTLISFGAPDAQTPALADIPAALSFSTSGVNGNVGCNGFGGNYTFSNDMITFSEIVSTLMACDEAIMTQEQAVLNGLNNATTFIVSADRLTINYQNADGSVGTLNFTRTDSVTVVPDTAEPNTDPTLRGLAGSWNLLSYGPADAQTTALTDAPALITFSEAGIGGNAGCNNFSGSFTFDNNQLSIGVLASTRMACADNVMAQETAVINALGNTTGYSISGDTLVLNYLNADGSAGVLTFARAV
ncbi:MAG: META domain-containing protein [Anaerolineae bacterium]